MLKGLALDKWNELIPELEAMGVLSKVDGDAVARYCQAWQRYVEAESFLDTNGMVYPVEDKDGNVRALQPFPQTWISKQAQAELHRLAGEFGLTPASRVRLESRPGDRHSEPLLDFIAQKSAQVATAVPPPLGKVPAKPAR